MDWPNQDFNEVVAEDELTVEMYNAMDGPSEEEVYLAGKILPVLTFGQS